MINFENMPLHPNMLCKSLRVCKWLGQKWLSIHFLFLSNKDINSVSKIAIANIANSFWAWQVCGLLKF